MLSVIKKLDIYTQGTKYFSTYYFKVSVLFLIIGSLALSQDLYISSSVHMHSEAIYLYMHI